MLTRAFKPVLNVRLSGEECDELRRIGARNGTDSLAAIVRMIVRDYIRGNGGVAGHPVEETHGSPSD
jgi:hypothetical protein